MGQGDFTIEYPPMHDLVASNNKYVKWAHDYLLYVDPQPHRETFLKDFHTKQTAQFCSSCPQGAPRCAGQQLSLVPRASMNMTTGRPPACRVRAHGPSITPQVSEVRGLSYAAGGV
jgi:hypothetical protein